MRRLRLALADIAWYARKLGAVRTIRRLARLCLDALSRNLYSHSVVIVHCTDLRSWPDYEPDAGLTIRLGDAADLERLAREFPPSFIHELRNRFAEGQMMFLAEVEGEPAAFAWMCTRSDTRAARDHALTLEPGEAIHWGSVTRERFQRRGIYTSLQKFSRAYMKTQGYARIYGGADTRNPAPLRMMKNLALKPVHLRHLRRILGRKRQWVEPLPPGFRL